MWSVPGRIGIEGITSLCGSTKALSVALKVNIQASTEAIAARIRLVFINSTWICLYIAAAIYNLYN